VHEARADGIDADDVRLHSDEERCGAESRQRVAAFEAGEMLAIDRQRGRLEGVRRASFVTPCGCGVTLGGNP
jgi:hypothetical protein